MTIIWGINALNHDAAITVMNDSEILFAAHSERYSRVKNDYYLNQDIISAALYYGAPSEIIWYEHPYKKKTRQAFAGQWNEVCTITPQLYLNSLGLNSIPVKYECHHRSHAAGGYFTSTFKDAAIIVIDGIGEWDTVSLWHGTENTLTKVHSAEYPHSLGLLYSAFTQRVGLKPCEEEYILMGMAAYGEPIYYDDIYNDFIESDSFPEFKLSTNVHKGILNWKSDLTTEADYANIAVSIQKVSEDIILKIIKWAKKNVDSDNLVLSGGVALNCIANEKIAKSGLYKDIWIMPNPGDAGSSLGAILSYTNEFANWQTPYLGTDINRKLDIDEVTDSIIKNKIIGIANGRAEFGPRALGNRSLIADPQGNDIKNKVNNIKKRQQFRPFAPVILEELVDKYFELPIRISPYMQFTAKCKYPKLFPAICHYDNTSRVQTINKQQNELLYSILMKFYSETGCPMLLNTSLNIKGEPLADSWEDALRFQQKYNVNIY
jgi:carbamoyltransferase